MNYASWLIFFVVTVTVRCRMPLSVRSTDFIVGLRLPPEWPSFLLVGLGMLLTDLLGVGLSYASVLTFFIVGLRMIPSLSPNSGYPRWHQSLSRFAKSNSSTTPAHAKTESSTNNCWLEDEDLLQKN